MDALPRNSWRNMEQNEKSKQSPLHQLVSRLALAWAKQRGLGTGVWLPKARATFEAYRRLADRGLWHDTTGSLRGEALYEETAKGYAAEFLAGSLKYGLIDQLERRSRVFFRLGLCRLIEDADWTPAARVLVERVSPEVVRPIHEPAASVF